MAAPVLYNSPKSRGGEGPGAKAQTILDTAYRKWSFRFSPDGQYVVYVSNEAGPSEVYVASFPSFAVKKKVSTGGGQYPAWGESGKEVFYHGSDGSLTSAQIRTSPNLVVDAPKPLFKLGIGPYGNGFAVSADGQRFLINEFDQTDESKITLVLNWAADIR
ncbi:hypothetical protein SBA6_330009 [Candidatus Sulfopaludibacter sp. SbA6]|nr:hypothetical protein SBA6_330009 [Candidatus Sulfopaludibacter sp. SbA6]